MRPAECNSQFSQCSRNKQSFLFFPTTIVPKYFLLMPLLSVPCLTLFSLSLLLLSMMMFLPLTEQTCWEPCNFPDNVFDVATWRCDEQPRGDRSFRRDLDNIQCAKHLGRLCTAQSTHSVGRVRDRTPRSKSEWLLPDITPQGASDETFQDKRPLGLHDRFAERHGNARRLVQSAGWIAFRKHLFRECFFYLKIV